MGIDLSALIGGVNRNFAALGEGRRAGEDRSRRISQEDEDLARRRRADALAESIRTGKMEKAAQEQARLRQERGVAEANLTEGIRAAEGRLDPNDVAAIGNLIGQARLDALGELETRQRSEAEGVLKQQQSEAAATLAHTRQLEQTRATEATRAASRVQPKTPQEIARERVVKRADEIMRQVVGFPREEAIAQANQEAQADQNFFRNARSDIAESLRQLGEQAGEQSPEQAQALLQKYQEAIGALEQLTDEEVQKVGEQLSVRGAGGRF